jgi:succinate dehydrogenase/fumarate reductase-like Fe-S protein
VAQLQKFGIYRYDPESQAKPFLQEYTVDLRALGCPHQNQGRD